MILKTVLQQNLYAVSAIIDSFIAKCTSLEYIDRFKNDIDLFDNMANDVISSCCSTIAAGRFTPEQERSYLDRAEKECADGLIDRLKQLESNVDHSVILSDLQEINRVIKNSLEQDSFKLLNSYSKFENNIRDSFTVNIFNDIKNRQQSKINQIIGMIPNSGDIDSVTLSNIKNELRGLHSSIKHDLSEKNYLKNVIDESVIINNVNSLKNDIEEYFPTKDHNSSKELLDDFMENYTDQITSERKEKVDSVLKLNYTTDGIFSKIYPKKYSCPHTIGCGYRNLLFLADKYRNTILPLISNSGGNCIAFSIINDTTDLKEREEIVWNTESQTYTKNTIQPKEHELMMDYVSIIDYDNMWNDLSQIDTTTKWWSNLKEILTQVSIYDMIAVITLQDFMDRNHPFIKNVEEKNRFTESMWSKDREEKFYSTLISVIKECGSKVILNLGYGHYVNTTDLKNEKYPIYPTCGYLRKMINYLVYDCNFTSNWLSLTANENDNLYYYNPYCEWYSNDDDTYHTLTAGTILNKDCIDDKFNDEAICVSYDEDSNISGGYAKCIIDADKHSIPIFHMLNLKDRISDSDDINDPNIMSKIFCYNSRNAIRYFKLSNYFDFNEIEFDENGDVK